MELVKWQARSCTTCPEGRGCNERAPWFETTVELRDIIRGYYDGGEIPKGTHVELLDVDGNGLNRYMNLETGLPFHRGDVVELLTPIGRYQYGKIKSDKENPAIQGAILRYWMPTHRPVTRGGSEDAVELYWSTQYDEAVELMAKELRILEFERSEAKVFADYPQVLKKGVEKGKIGPPADYTRGESFMKAGTGWRFLKAAGACPNPVRYVRAFPEDMPVAEMWHDYLRNGKQSPMGQDIEWYWVTTIINYAPGLLRECTERTARWLKENRPDYVRRRNAGNHHFDDEEYRHAFFDINPWEEIEFRLRQTGEQDRQKKEYEVNGLGRYIYTPNEHDIKTGIYRRPVKEDQPQEQEAAAAKAA